jgi:hypothetical protein
MVKAGNKLGYFIIALAGLIIGPGLARATDGKASKTQEPIPVEQGLCGPRTNEIPFPWASEIPMPWAKLSGTWKFQVDSEHAYMRIAVGRRTRTGAVPMRISILDSTQAKVVSSMDVSPMPEERVIIGNMNIGDYSHLIQLNAYHDSRCGTDASFVLRVRISRLENDALPDLREVVVADSISVKVKER